MSSILKVDQLQDSGGNNLVTSNGSGVITAAGFGKIKQIKYAFNTDSHSTSATTFSDVETVSITPSNANSIIKLTFTGRSYTPTTSLEHKTRFLRDSTELERYLGQWTTSGATAQREIFEWFDDAHNTTSEITYKFQHASNSAGSLVYFSPNGGGADGGVYLTAMEILP